MDVMDVLKDNNNEELLSDAEEIVEEMSRSESDDEENSKRYENIPTEVVNAAKEFEEFTREKGVSEIILGKEGSTLRRKGWSPWFVYKKDEGLSFLNHPFLGVRYIKLDSEGKILIYNRPKLTWIPKRINPEHRERPRYNPYDRRPVFDRERSPYGPREDYLREPYPCDSYVREPPYSREGPYRREHYQREMHPYQEMAPRPRGMPYRSRDRRAMSGCRY